METLSEQEKILLKIIAGVYKSQPNYKEAIKVERPDSNITKEKEIWLPEDAKLKNIVCINQKDYTTKGLTPNLFQIALNDLIEKGFLVGKESLLGDYPFTIYTDRQGKEHKNVEFDIKEFWGDYRIEVCDKFLTKYHNFEKAEKNKRPDDKIEIYFSDSNGFYYDIEDEDKYRYKIKEKRIDLIKEAKKHNGILEITPDLAKKIGYSNYRDIYKYIEDINECFCKTVGLGEYYLFLKADPVGYKLNDKDFHIVFL